MPNTEEWLKTLTPEMKKDFKEMDKRGMYETILDLGYRCDSLESDINEKKMLQLKVIERCSL